MAAKAESSSVGSPRGIWTKTRNPLKTIELPTPPVAVLPGAGGAPTASDPLVVSGEGVFEHVLVPETSGPRIRIIAAQREAVVPDTQTLGAAPAVGAYTWTVRCFPKLRFSEQLTGVYARRYTPMGASPPRSLVLR